MFQLELTCGVMSQKEGPEELYDEKCGKDCPDKMAGLCKLVGIEEGRGKRYKERGRRNGARIDLFPTECH